MNTHDLLQQALDDLEECARLLGATQAKEGFGCYTENDARFERLMYESIGKHRRCAIEAAQAQPADKPVVTITVVPVGPGISRLDYSGNNWWHKLPPGQHKLYTRPQPPAAQGEKS